MKISIGADHAGYPLKEHVRKYLEEKGHEVLDMGTKTIDSVDYPDYGKAVGNSVASGETEYGVVVCGSGIGISIAANKVPGIRCALVNEPLSAELSRRHNDANVIAMGARLIGNEMAERLVDVFLSTEFEGGRHCGRVEKID